MIQGIKNSNIGVEFTKLHKFWIFDIIKPTKILVFVYRTNCYLNYVVVLYGQSTNV